MVLGQLLLPDDARHLLGSLIEPDPDKRPFTAKLALAELDRVLVWHPQAPPDRRPQLMVAFSNTALKQTRGLLGAAQSTRRRADS